MTGACSPSTYERWFALNPVRLAGSAQQLATLSQTHPASSETSAHNGAVDDAVTVPNGAAPAAASDARDGGGSGISGDRSSDSSSDSSSNADLNSEPSSSSASSSAPSSFTSSPRDRRRSVSLAAKIAQFYQGVARAAIDDAGGDTSTAGALGERGSGTVLEYWDTAGEGLLRNGWTLTVRRVATRFGAGAVQFVCLLVCLFVVIFSPPRALTLKSKLNPQRHATTPAQTEKSYSDQTAR
jgi:hypothetical protein